MQEFVGERHLERGDHVFVLLRLGADVAHTGVPEQEDKLVAAEAADHVRRACVIAEAHRNRLQDRIAGQMAVLIVDGLEVVQVDEDQARGGAVALHMRQRAIELALEAAAVEHVEQRIGFDLLLKMADALARGAELGIEFFQPIEDQLHGNVFHRSPAIALGGCVLRCKALRFG